MPPRILHVGARNFPPAHGGTERLVHHLVQSMTAVESHVVVDEGHDVSLRRVSVLPSGLVSRWAAVRQYVRANAIDIVHIHKSSNIPLALLLKWSGLTCVLTVHGCVWRRAERRWPLPIKGLFWGLDFLACTFLDRVVLVGEHDWLSFRAVFPKGRLSLIRNGVAVNGAPSQPGRSGWVYLGRISPEKNVLGMLRAAASLPERLVVYGPISPPNARFEEDFRTELRRSNAEWRGPVVADQVRATLARHRVFVNPSFTEGLPFTALEAAAEGLYLVLSDIRPHRLLRFPCCTYVDPNHLNFAECSRQELGTGEPNRELVSKEYNIRNTLREYEQLYQSLVERAK